MKGGLDAEMEKLYQLPLEDFTAARNALAKGAGKRAAEVRGLTKPPVTAWAVNQLYWTRRKVYDALIDAAQDARKAHAAILAGKDGDVRSTGKDHDERVSEALDATLELLREAGHPATDASRQAIITTLRALPADEPAGMLTRALQPGGFEALTGLSIRGAKAQGGQPHRVILVRRIEAGGFAELPFHLQTVALGKSDIREQSVILRRLLRARGKFAHGHIGGPAIVEANCGPGEQNQVVRCGGAQVHHSPPPIQRGT